MSENLDEICKVLDKLTLDSLTKCEELIQLKLNIENTLIEGDSNLAKTRYILGQNSVSAVKLPTDSSDVQAIINVENDGNKRELIVSSDKTDPIKWFGYLLPQNMYKAQTLYRKTLDWIVETVNLETEIKDNCNKIQQLKEIKTQIS